MDRDKIQSALMSKGFELDESGDHKYLHHIHAGKKTGVKTKLSRGKQYKRLDASLLSKIKKQLKLDTSSELRDFIDCPMTKDEYLNILRGKGII